MRIIFAIKEISKKLSADNISGYAAQSCFYLVLSFFPFILLLLSLIRFLPISYYTFLLAMKEVTPIHIHPLLDGIMSDLFERSSATLTFATAIGTLWASSKGFMSLMGGLNSVYHIKETRNWIIQRLISTIYTLVFLIIILLSLILLVFGNQLLVFTSQYTPHLSAFILAILDEKLIIFPAMLMLFFMIMYKFVPSRNSSFFKEFPGAVLATIGWYLFSYCYSLYVDFSPNFSYMYGSLTAFIFSLVWIYSCMIIMFFGAEFNTLIDTQIITHHLFHREK